MQRTRAGRQWQQWQLKHEEGLYAYALDKRNYKSYNRYRYRSKKDNFVLPNARMLEC